EYFWRDHYNWLKSCGYCLRARYHPDWIPSWIIRDDLVDYEQEDFWIDGADACNMDAVRMEDGIAVKLKLIHLREYIEEEKLLYKLDEDALATDPQNHCMPTFEILNVPGEEEDLRIVITPLLRDWDDPRFDTVGEVVSVIQQIFEGMNFMHTHGIAYCSTVRNNIKLDPWDMYPDGFHPSNHTVPSDWDIYGVAKHYTRTQCSPRYYLEISPTSLIYSTRHGATAASIDGVDGAVFEVQQDGCSTYFPFAEDCLHVGSLHCAHMTERQHGFQVFKDFDFLRPLAEEMTLNSHVHRPQMEDAIHRLDALIKGMSSSQLRSPAVYKSDHSLVRVYRAIGYWKRRLFFTATSTPPIP
ncbi:hypothetical protein PUNSTDRAFT_39424, partial [Punctularia strigosozonata HHB-11173 SS5]|uniref:uncharacterized protein n=1 Tax=Punctularia strigosozonata (strain HHB-11173) TaxID=741275 RepID=UPI0004417742